MTTKLDLRIKSSIETTEGRANFTASTGMSTVVRFEAAVADYRVGDFITVTIERGQ